MSISSRHIATAGAGANSDGGPAPSQAGSGPVVSEAGDADAGGPPDLPTEARQLQDGGEESTEASKALGCEFAPTAACATCVVSSWDGGCLDQWSALEALACRASQQCVRDYCFCSQFDCLTELCSCVDTCIVLGSACEDGWTAVLECSQEECAVACGS